MIVRHETKHDIPAVWRVNRAAFESAAEANLVDALREQGFVEVLLVAEHDGQIVGDIVFSRLAIVTPAGVVNALALAPVAVVPDHQRMGIGSKLVAAGIEACRRKGHRIIAVLGHSDFYPRFGFSAELAQRLESPFGGGSSWMALELIAGALNDITGRVEYPPPFQKFS